MGEERAGCFTLIFILMSCGDYYCSVALSHDGVGWSAVYCVFFWNILIHFFLRHISIFC